MDKKDILGVFLKVSLPALILMGVVKLTSYYYQFHIPIIEYLNLSEITTLFLGDIATYLIFLMIIFFSFIGVSDRKYIVMSVLLGIVMFFVYVINEDLSFNSAKIAIGICFIVMFISSFLFKINISSHNVYFFLIFIFFLILSAISISSYFNASDVKKHHVFSGTQITFTDTTITSNESFYYIGKTEGYIFFYDPVNKSPSIYKTENVNKIVFVSKKVKRGMDQPEHSPPNP